MSVSLQNISKILDRGVCSSHRTLLDSPEFTTILSSLKKEKEIMLLNKFLSGMKKCLSAIRSLQWQISFKMTLPKLLIRGQCCSSCNTSNLLTTSLHKNYSYKDFSKILSCNSTNPILLLRQTDEEHFNIPPCWIVVGSFCAVYHHSV